MEDPRAANNTSNDSSAAEAPSPVQAHPGAAELVAKAIAPVKREFLRPPPVRTCDGIDGKKADDKETVQNDGASAPILKEKKSKRQLKRERRQVRKCVGCFGQLIVWYMKWNCLISVFLYCIRFYDL